MSSHGRRRGGGWRGRGGGQRKGNAEQPDTSSKRSRSADVDENNPVIKAFRGYQVEMDARNDRYERIMKINRDITIDSKRLIFLLQRVNGSEDKGSLLAEADEKMKELHTTKFQALARELEGQDIYQFLKAFTGGLQEYIEAVTFYQYLVDQQLASVDLIKSKLEFDVAADVTPPVSSPVQSTIDKMTDLATSETGDGGETRKSGSIATQQISTQDEEHVTSTSAFHHAEPKICELNFPNEVQVSESGNSCDPAHQYTAEQPCSAVEQTFSTVDQACSTVQQVVSLRVPVPPSEYMLGVADFTGELMRMAINSVGCGDLETPRVIAQMMRVIHDAFCTFSNSSRELRRKTTVLRQSLAKVERACYTLEVRGSEIPKHMLADVFSSSAGQGDNFVSEETEDLYD